jgi:hypothetical protein
VLVAGIDRLSVELKIAELVVLKQSMVHYRFGNKSKIWRAAIDVSFAGRVSFVLDRSSRSPGPLSSFTYPVVAADSADAKLGCISTHVGIVQKA